MAAAVNAIFNTVPAKTSGLLAFSVRIVAGFVLMFAAYAPATKHHDFAMIRPRGAFQLHVHCEHRRITPARAELSNANPETPGASRFGRPGCVSPPIDGGEGVGKKWKVFGGTYAEPGRRSKLYARQLLTADSRAAN